MTILTSASGARPLSLAKGETLIIRNYSGTETVTGSTAAREDASAVLGAGAVVYGPQTGAATVTISTTGALDHSTVMGDPIQNPASTDVRALPFGSFPTYAGTISRAEIFCGGQSLMEMRFEQKNGAPIAAVMWARRIRQYMGFSPAASMVYYAPGAYPGIAVVSDGTAKDATDFTVRLVNCARGGSALLDVGNATTVDPAQQGGNSNYWWNTQDNSAISSGGAADAVPNTPGPLLRRLLSAMSGRTPTAFCWSQGESEIAYLAASSANRAFYKQKLVEVFNYIRAQVGNASLPIFITRVGRRTGGLDVDYTYLRDIQTEIANENDNIYIDADNFDKQFGSLQTFTSTVTSGSTTIAVPNTAGLVVGREIFGTGLVGGTYIKTIVANTNITVDASRTPNASATNTTLRQRDTIHLYPGDADALDTDTNGDAVNDAYSPMVGYFQVCYQSARSIARALAGVSLKEFGPRIIDMQVFPGATRIRLKVKHDQGSGLITRNGSSLTTAAPHFKVTIDGVVKAVNDVQAVTGANDMYELTFSAALPAGLLVVEYGRQLNYDAGGLFQLQDFKGLLIDNSVSQMPLLPAKFTIDMAS